MPRLRYLREGFQRFSINQILFLVKNNISVRQMTEEDRPSWEKKSRRTGGSGLGRSSWAPWARRRARSPTRTSRRLRHKWLSGIGSTYLVCVSLSFSLVFCFCVETMCFCCFCKRHSTDTLSSSALECSSCLSISLSVFNTAYF